MIPINEFRRNQSQFPRAELEKYNGQFVAWSHDGTHILAAHADPAQVDAMLVAMDIYPGDVLVSWVSLTDEVTWWVTDEESARP
jgi:hypothetical protein